jgi:plastocyanin
MRCRVLSALIAATALLGPGCRSGRPASEPGTSVSPPSRATITPAPTIAAADANAPVPAVGSQGVQAVGVDIADNAYRPQTRATYFVGVEVTWIHEGRSVHSVRSEDGIFDSSPRCPASGACMTRGDSFTHKFNEAGTFRYFCAVHGGPGGQGMSGAITVESFPTTTRP